MPTALERIGDFSQTRTGGSRNGRPGCRKRSAHRQSVRRQRHPVDPPRPPRRRSDEYLPAAQRHRPSATTILTQEPSIDHPRRAQLMRFDHPPDGERHRSASNIRTGSPSPSGWEVAGRSSPWGLVRQRYDFTADQGKVEWTRIWTPHLVMEASIGIFYSTEVGPPEDRSRPRQHSEGVRPQRRARRLRPTEACPGRRLAETRRRPRTD